MLVFRGREKHILRSMKQLSWILRYSRGSSGSTDIMLHFSNYLSLSKRIFIIGRDKEEYVLWKVLKKLYKTMKKSTFSNVADFYFLEGLSKVTRREFKEHSKVTRKKLEEHLRTRSALEEH